MYKMILEPGDRVSLNPREYGHGERVGIRLRKTGEAVTESSDSSNPIESARADLFQFMFWDWLPYE